MPSLACPTRSAIKKTGHIRKLLSTADCVVISRIWKKDPLETSADNLGQESPAKQIITTAVEETAQWPTIFDEYLNTKDQDVETANWPSPSPKST